MKINDESECVRSACLAFKLMGQSQCYTSVYAAAFVGMDSIPWVDCRWVSYIFFFHFICADALTYNSTEISEREKN